MPYAITLRLNADAASQVVAMWETLASRGVSNDAISLGYAPHLTLAVFQDTADPGRLIMAARIWAARWQALPITFASLGIFPGTPATLFLTPVVTAALLTIHANVLGWLVDESVDPHYQSGNWVPHVTLAGDVTDPVAALAALGPLGLPISAVLATTEVVRFRPVHVLASYLLLAG